MADYCRPEVDTDVTSYRKVEGVEVVLETEFGDPSSNRLGAIKIPHFVTTTTATTTAARCMPLRPNQLRWLGRKNDVQYEKFFLPPNTSKLRGQMVFLE